MVSKRLGGAIAALAMLASACTRVQPEAEPTRIAGIPTIRPEPTDATTRRPGSADPTPRTTGQGATTATPPAISTEFPDKAGVGAMAIDFLSPRRASALIVEIDRVAGRQIPGPARDHLRSVLARELDKRSGISFVDDDVLPGNGAMAGGGDDDSYTIAELRSIARGTRDRASAGATVVMHAIILDGGAEAEGVIGIAIDASTMVLFADQIDEAAELLVSATDIWRSVLVHEAGHLLGLVELVERSATDRHADPRHKGHSPSRDSVMYWAVESSDIASVLDGGPPDDFDADDRADLAALRARR